MADEVESPVVTYLRRIDQKLDRLAEDMRDIKLRMTSADEGIAGVNRRLDRLEMRVDGFRYGVSTANAVQQTTKVGELTEERLDQLIQQLESALTK